MVEVIAFPQVKYSRFYKADTSKIIYQFYERFGFGEVCTSYTVIVEANFSVGENWIPLPITSENLKKINGIENKVMDLPPRNLQVFRDINNSFQDIRLEAKFFLRDKENPIVLPLVEGYYRFDKNSFEIFDSQRKVIYFEMHNCN